MLLVNGCGFGIVVGTKFRASALKEQEVRAYREVERQAMHKMLDEYLSICRKMGVNFLLCFFFCICYVIGLFLKYASELWKSCILEKKKSFEEYYRINLKYFSSCPLPVKN